MAKMGEEERMRNDAEHLNAIGQIFDCWGRGSMRFLRLGQMIVCATNGRDLFSLPDHELLNLLQEFSSKGEEA